MTCSCPKCNTQVEFDPAVIQAEGSFNKCPECHADFIIRKESFAKRALYKGNEISCIECGDRPGSSIFCQNCHAIYPDILVIEISSAAKKLLGKISVSLNVLKVLEIGGSAKPSLEKRTATTSSQGKTKGLRLPGQPAQLAAVLAAILIFSAIGGYYWYQDKIATAYSENYVRVIFAIKSARDFELKTSNRVATAMKSGAAAILTAEEQKSATAGKADADMLMKRIGKVPKKFTASNHALTTLYESYSKLHSTVTSPAGMADTYSAAVKQMDDEFKKSASALKAGLPEKISAQLATSTKKYKVLQDF